MKEEMTSDCQTLVHDCFWFAN